MKKKIIQVEAKQLRAIIREELASVMDGPDPEWTDKRFDLVEQLVDMVAETVLNAVPEAAAPAEEDGASGVIDIVRSSMDDMVTRLADAGYVV